MENASLNMISRWTWLTHLSDSDSHHRKFIEALLGSQGSTEIQRGQWMSIASAGVAGRWEGGGRQEVMAVISR